MLNEWIKTGPPLRDVESTAKKFALGQASLTDYAGHRSIAERSRLWITLHEANSSVGTMSGSLSTRVDAASFTGTMPSSSPDARTGGLDGVRRDGLTVALMRLPLPGQPRFTAPPTRGRASSPRICLGRAGHA